MPAIVSRWLVKKLIGNGPFDAHRFKWLEPSGGFIYRAYLIQCAPFLDPTRQFWAVLDAPVNFTSMLASSKLNVQGWGWRVIGSIEDPNMLTIEPVRQAQGNP
jgi:hypothetical protein